VFAANTSAKVFKLGVRLMWIVAQAALSNHGSLTTRALVSQHSQLPAYNSYVVPLPVLFISFHILSILTNFFRRATALTLHSDNLNMAV
jgi:hypothetical protein